MSNHTILHSKFHIAHISQQKSKKNLLQKDKLSSSLCPFRFCSFIAIYKLQHTFYLQMATIWSKNSFAQISSTCSLPPLLQPSLL